MEIKNKFSEEQNPKNKEQRLKAEEERLKAEEERLKAEEQRLKAEEQRLKAEEQRLKAEEEINLKNLRESESEEKGKRLNGTVLWFTRIKVLVLLKEKIKKKTYSFIFQLCKILV